MGRKSGAHSIHRLSQSWVTKISERPLAAKPGLYADGGGLYLQVAPAGSRSWLFRYMINGRARSMGLGPLHVVPLDDARQAALLARKQRVAGLDPLEVRQELQAITLEGKQAKQDLLGKTWQWCCETYVREVKLPELSNVKHAAQWGTTLDTYTYPLLANKPVGAVTVDDVHAVLKDIWLTKNETASRVRGRMEAVWGWAKIKKLCSGDNPATWGGALEHLLAKRTKQVTGERAHPALPYDLMPDFMVELHKSKGISAQGLEFLILTAQRTGPIVLATWDEIDWERKVWMSSAANMKADFPHRTPLSPAAIKVLERALERKNGDFIFHNDGERMTDPAMHTLISKMHAKHPWMIDPKENNRRITPHGFRSTFTDWAAETTEHEFKAYDKALAHGEKNQTVAAYLRGDMLEKRRPLMRDWANFVNGQSELRLVKTA